MSENEIILLLKQTKDEMLEEWKSKKQLKNWHSSGYSKELELESRACYLLLVGLLDKISGG